MNELKYGRIEIFAVLGVIVGESGTYCICVLTFTYVCICTYQSIYILMYLNVYWYFTYTELFLLHLCNYKISYDHS